MAKDGWLPTKKLLNASCGAEMHFVDPEVKYRGRPIRNQVAEEFIGELFLSESTPSGRTLAQGVQPSTTI
jgi:hypothetical protein